MTTYREYIMNSGKELYTQAVSYMEYGVQQLPTIPYTSTSMGHIFTLLPSLKGAAPLAVYGYGVLATIVGHVFANKLGNWMVKHSQSVRDYIAPQRKWMKKNEENKVPAEDNDITAKNIKNGTVFPGDYIKTTTWVQFTKESLKKIVCTTLTETTSAVTATGLGAAAGAVIAAATATAFVPAIVSAAALTALTWFSIFAVRSAVTVAVTVVVNGVAMIFKGIKALFAFIANSIKRCKNYAANRKLKAAHNEAVNKAIEDFNKLKYISDALHGTVKGANFRDKLFRDLRVAKENDIIIKVYVEDDSTTNLLDDKNFTQGIPHPETSKKKLEEYKNAINNIQVGGTAFSALEDKSDERFNEMKAELSQIDTVITIIDHVVEKKK